MGIYFPGMMMPTECWECPCAYETEGAHHNYCQAVGYDTQLPDEGRPDWCPLIELHPHGRLIDADAFAAKYIAALPGGIDDLIDKSRAPEFVSRIQALLMDIAEAPTIIPADGGENK